MALDRQQSKQKLHVGRVDMLQHQLVESQQAAELSSEHARRQEAENLLGLATHRKADAIVAEFRGLPFEPYAPVRRQLLELFRLVNRARRAAGFDQVPITCIRLRRRIVKPFGEEGEPCAAEASLSQSSPGHQA